MDFSFSSALVREIANGTMGLSALLLIVVFSFYCWKNWRSFRRSKTTQAAGAILILLVGHFIRAAGAWIEFILLRKEFDLSFWITASASWFILAAVLIAVGKGCMIYTFTPARVWPLILGGFSLCVAIPILVVFL